MTEPTSESTIGLDLGDRWSRYCVIDSRGVVVKEDRVRSNPEALEETFRVILPCRIVIEAGTHSPWVSRLLERLGHQDDLAAMLVTVVAVSRGWNIK